MDAKIVTALVVMVFAVVALKVIVPVALQIVPVTSDMLPEIASVPVLVNVTVPAETVISRHVSAPVIVTVYVPAWSKKTLSVAVGTDAPDAPPDDADQLVVLLVFQVPVPPTQYRFAMITPQGQQEHPQPAHQPAAQE